MIHGNFSKKKTKQQHSRKLRYCVKVSDFHNNQFISITSPSRNYFKLLKLPFLFWLIIKYANTAVEWKFNYRNVRLIRIFLVMFALKQLYDPIKYLKLMQSDQNFSYLKSADEQSRSVIEWIKYYYLLIYLSAENWLNMVNWLQ